MISKFEFFFDFCQNTQTFHYVSKHHKKNIYEANSQHIETASVDENKFYTDLPYSMVHSWNNSQDILLTARLLALINKNCKNKNEKLYKEDNLETDKTLLVEMPHALQGKDDLIGINKAEAESLHNGVYGDIWSEPYEIIEINGKQYKFTKKQIKTMIEREGYNLVKWLEEQKVILDEEEYLQLLCNVEKLLKRYRLKTPKTSYEVLQHEIINNFRSRIS